MTATGLAFEAVYNTTGFIEAAVREVLAEELLICKLPARVVLIGLGVGTVLLISQGAVIVTNSGAPFGIQFEQ
jgi:hypothetical protein